MNFLELCQRLRQETGSIGNGPSSVTGQAGDYARLVSWIQAAWQEIQNERRWRFDWIEGSVVLAAGVTQSALPGDFDTWDADTLKFGSDPIAVLPWSEFESADRFTAVALAPDGTMRLNAAPTQMGTLTFEYWRTPQVLQIDTDVPRMPERFHMAIVHRAHAQYGYYESAPEALEMAVRNEARLMNALVESQLPTANLPDALA